MKNFSDNFSDNLRQKCLVFQKITLATVLIIATSFMVYSQDLVITEGSIHSFSVERQQDNVYQWSLHDEVFNLLDPSYCDFTGTENSTNVVVRFNDLNRTNPQIVLLAVQETSPLGCSTKRALKILLEPNNMYLEFASAMTQDCFTGTEYNAPLKVGLNFKDKAAGVPIPESRFPLKVTYSVRNITAGTPAIAGNSNNPLTMAFDPTNEYYMLVTEAVGLPNETTEYELTITSVKDKYDAEITNNSGDIRLQIRVINHLPQSGNMDMALAYYEIVR